MKDRFGFDWSGIAGKRFWRAPHLSRRMLFRHAASALSGYFPLPQRPSETVARAAASPVGTAENCILVFLTGAPSHIDTFDLKEGTWTPAFFAPETYGEIRWPRGLMPRLAEQLDSIAIGRSLRAYATAHGLAQSWVQIGRNPISTTASIAPHIGSVVSAEFAPRIQERTLPVFMHLNAASGPGAGYLPPDHEPFYVTPNGGGLPNTRHPDGEAALNRRYALQLALDAELMADPSRGAVTDESVKYKERARRMMYNANIDAIFLSDAATRELEVNVAFDAPPARFAIDQEAEVTIDAGGEQGVVVPLAALTRNAEGVRGVLVVADGRTRFRPVETGGADGERVLIRKGLAAGERIVAQAQGVRANLRVRAASS